MAKYRNGNVLVKGRISPSSIRFIYIELGEESAHIPLTLFGIDERAAKALLARNNIVLPSPAWRQVLDEVGSISKFEPAQIADRVGWNEGSFVRQNGEVVAHTGAEPPELVADLDPSAGTRAGTLSGWLSGVAEPLSEQSLPMVLFMLAFAAALVELIARREDPGFEVGGKPGCGKTTLLVLVASISGKNQAGSFHSTLDGLEDYMAASNGHLLLLDEANLFYGDEAGPKRDKIRIAVAFKLARGEAKKRFGGAPPQRSFYTFLTSTNEPLASAGESANRHVAAAAADRLMTLNIAESRPHQTFDFVPESYDTAGAFAKALERASSEHYGHAMPVFLQGLVDALADDRAATIARIQANIELWRKKVGVDDDDGAVGRVGEAFGLLYAAGEEAKRHGALPSNWGCGKAVATVYREFYTGPKAPRPIDDDLRAYLTRPGVRDLDKQGVRPMGPKLFARTPAFLKRGCNGSLEARIPPSQAAQNLPGLKNRIGESRASVRLLSEPGHSAIWREVRTGKRDRMVVLALPSDFF